VARRILWASLALAPLPILLRYVFDADEVTLFVFAAIALVPLAWLIGEATEHAAEHTGPGVGGFLNASFGNAPELIIALFAISDGLPNVVRGSLAGSVIGNLLLVLGFAVLLGQREEVDRDSLLRQLGLVSIAVLLFLIPSVPGFTGDPDRHALVVATVPVAIVLIGLYVGMTTLNLRRHRRAHVAAADGPGELTWSMPVSMVALSIATVVTAVVSEILVHSLDSFARAAGLSQFFVSIVVVAIVGNAAEHGGAVVIARRGKTELATEIAVSSSAQVALLVASSIALLSWVVKPPLSLAFRWEELLAMAAATVLAAAIVADGRTRRWEGVVLLTVYVGIAFGFALAGDR
jgi:Ca2+:H+ antiporter